jgi:hypothetical protein
MLATTPSRVRMRALTGLGRRLPAHGGEAAAGMQSASRRRAGGDGAAIATVTPPRPSAVSARPGVGAVAEASI